MTKETFEDRFDKEFLDCRKEHLSQGKPACWKEKWDGGDQVVRRGDPIKIKSFISTELTRARQEERERIKELLLEKGHGGGNWRRLIIQMKK